MRKSRTFTASGIDALEDRVVLSQGAASAATGVIHGHKAQRVAADFASFQSSYNNTITPLVKEIQNPATSSDQVYSDEEQISVATTNMVNGLGNQLAKQLRPKMYSRIRTLVTGASDPGTVGFASTSPSPGSLLATLNSLSNDALANPALVNNLISVYQDALITGHSATAVRGDFINFEHAFNKAIPPLVDNVQSASTPAESAQAQQALDAEIVTLVNSFGTQLSNDLGAPGQSAIRSLITGLSSSSGVSFTSGTPITGSLLATLMSVPADELDNWDFVSDVVSVYASSSRSFT
jgi:hypothetical protein